MITPVNDYFLELKETSGLTADTISRYPIILRENGSGSLKQADSILHSLGISIEDLNIVARINDQESIKNLTASGLGISFISDKAAENFVREKRLLSFELPETSAVRSFYLIYQKNHPMRSYVDAFIKYVLHYDNF